ncbi:MAG: DUF1646 family protein [Deltaproteobacteria bacterium]|nr:DUF1646 family protein [Deltaproteobacteria bacterium]
MLIALIVILVLVLVLPFAFKKVEHNLEIFLFIMGMAAAFFASRISGHLVAEALREPLPITGAVLGFGLLFKWTRSAMDRIIRAVLKRIPVPLFIFLLILWLGLTASIVTAIIAALVLVEVISMLNLDKEHELELVVLACYAIGIGAVLTPLGEPLSTIAIAKLKSWPDVDFWYLLRLLGWEVLGSVMVLALLSFLIHGRHSTKGLGVHKKKRDEPYREIFLRTGKVYLFVMALVFLGEGFKPLIDTYVIHLSADILYWINISSAVLDNATLTAAEISPSMTPLQVKKLLMGLLLSGGMLIPGNIPNIISASKLKITMKEWARFGLPLGLIFMVAFFFILKME